MVLALRLKAQQASLMTPLHISGVENGIGDTPLRSFKGTPEWHCKTDAEFIPLFNSKPPLLNQNSSSLYHTPSSTHTRVISVLQMQGTKMDV